MSAVIVIGTYAGHVLAFTVHADRDAGRILAPILGLKAHGGSVRSVCTSGRFAVSASSDETMSVFDLVKVVDLGQLYQDSRGVSTVAMYGGSHLLTGSDGGRMAIFRSSDWEELTSMAAHPSGVVDVAIHPSGRLALSVGKEPQLYTWNLMRAKCVLKRPLDAPATAVRWSPAGLGCALLSGNDVLVLDLSSDGIAAKLAHAERALAFDYLTETLLVSGGEDKVLRLWDLSAGLADGDRLVCTRANAHTVRVKAIVRLGEQLLGTASSDGSLKLWRVTPAAAGAPASIEQVDGIELGVRITCLAASATGLPSRKADKAQAKARAQNEGAMSGKAAHAADAEAAAPMARAEAPSSKAPPARAPTAKKRAGAPGAQTVPAARAKSAAREPRSAEAVHVVSSGANGSSKAQKRGARPSASGDGGPRASVSIVNLKKRRCERDAGQ
ncbi:hypothetical protein KFE25_002471 [Diacronema lutheri]|uniref:P21-activated protein kinase-interacting protein 1-like n=1 Tax=Diacronema lutheri TaxID=2081491 RepID=A0A8J5XE78_DIALT|nr:hypothetical protein KFE25_002471 [Diacronema lutheri]